MGYTPAKLREMFGPKGERQINMNYSTGVAVRTVIDKRTGRVIEGPGSSSAPAPQRKRSAGKVSAGKVAPGKVNLTSARASVRAARKAVARARHGKPITIAQARAEVAAARQKLPLGYSK